MSVTSIEIHQIMIVRAEIGDADGALAWAAEQTSHYVTCLVSAAVAEGLANPKKSDR